MDPLKTATREEAILLGPGDYDVSSSQIDEDLLPAYEEGDGAAIGSVWGSLPTDVLSTPEDAPDFEVSPNIGPEGLSESLRLPSAAGALVDSVFEGGFRGAPQSRAYRTRPCAGQDRKRTAKILQFRAFWEQTGESFPVQP